MPIVLTDFRNITWCTEQMTDGFLHAGYTGQAGPRLQDLLDFASTRQNQFDRFMAKRRIEEIESASKKGRVPRSNVRSGNPRGANNSGEE